MRPLLGAVALVLLCVALLTTSSAASVNLTVPQCLRPAAAFAVPDSQTHTTADNDSLRARLRHQLAVPDTAVLILALGILLLFVESNLPGAILPGAAGLLLALAGIYGLSMHPLHPAALLLLLSSILLLSLAARTSLPFVLASAGTAFLIYGLRTLISPSNAEPRVTWPVALSAALVLGPSASILSCIATKARRNKLILASVSEPSIRKDPG